MIPRNFFAAFAVLIVFSTWFASAAQANPSVQCPSTTAVNEYIQFTTIAYINNNPDNGPHNQPTCDTNGNNYGYENGVAIFNGLFGDNSAIAISHRINNVESTGTITCSGAACGTNFGNFVMCDRTVAGGCTIGYSYVSGAKQTVSFSFTTSGQTIPAFTVNGSLYGSGPLISLIGPSAWNGQPTSRTRLTFEVDFDREVHDVDTGDFAVTGSTASVSRVTKSFGNSYLVDIAGGDLGTITGTVKLVMAGTVTITDNDGNALTKKTPEIDYGGFSVVPDTTPPTLSSVVVLEPETLPTNSGFARVIYIFSEVVQGFNAASLVSEGYVTSLATVVSYQPASGAPVTRDEPGIMYAVEFGSAADPVLAALNGPLALQIKPVNAVTDSVGNAIDLTSQPTTNPVFDHIAPGVEITGIPDDIQGAQTVTATIGFSEQVTGFDENDLAVVNGSVTGFSGSGANYSATILTTGHGDFSVAIAAGAARDTAGNDSQASAVVNTVNTVVPDTQAVIADFMMARANAILQSQTDMTDFLDGTRIGGGGPAGHLRLDADDDGGEFAFAASLNRIRALGDMPPGFGASPDGAGGMQAFRYDAWVDLDCSWGQSAGAHDSLCAGQFGAHYFIARDVIVGGVVQLDYSTQHGADSGSKVEGFGWMAGPYLAGKLPGQPIFYEAKLLWGRSENEISLNGTYTDDFRTNRLLAKIGVKGAVELGGWTISPGAAVSYFREKQESYVDSLSNLIPAQTIALGELKFGPSLRKDIRLADGAFLRPSIGLSGLVNFGVEAGAAGTVWSGNRMRARLDTGLGYSHPSGFSLAFDVFYDGLGAASYQSYGADVSFRKSF